MTWAVLGVRKACHNVISVEFWVALLYLILVVRWFVLSRRMKGLQRRIDDSDQQIAFLTQRLRALETGSAPVAVPAAIPVELPVIPSQSVAETVEATPPPLPPELTELPVAEPAAAEIPAFEAVDSPTPVAAKQKTDWEAFVGGNLLIKLGVLILVIGVALLLSWSLTELGPGGRVAVGLGVSLALLFGGIFTERFPLYVTFGRGLIAGGWAGLYFTAYAMHGLPQARVIEDPLAGFVLLLAVVVGMVLHSLRYRSETLTALTFFIAFFTLNLFPTTSFSLLAALPLTAFLLALCWRFDWSAGAVAGLALTYGTLLFQWREASQVWSHSALGVALLWSYWVLFEGFDLLSLWHRRARTGAFRTMFPLNACGFLFAATLPGSPIQPDGLTPFLAAAAAAYLVSGLIRARLQPAGEEEDLRTELLGGGYGWATALSAALLLGSLSRSFHGLALTRAILFEAELLTLAGVMLRRRMAQYIGAAVMVVPVVRLLFVDFQIHDQVSIAGASIYVWSLHALLAAGLCYLNRGLTGRLRPYTFVAGALVTTVLGRELEDQYWGLAWSILAMAQFLGARFTPIRELRWSAAVNGTLGFAVLILANALAEPVKPASPTVLWIAAALYYSGVYYAWTVMRGQPDVRAAKISFQVLSWMSVALLWFAVGRGFPSRWIVLGWAAAFVALSEAGVVARLSALRWQAYATAFVVLARLLFVSHDDRAVIAGIPQFVWTALPVAVAYYWAAWRLLSVSIGEMRIAGRALLYLGTVAFSSLLSSDLPKFWRAGGLAGLMAALLEVGLRFDIEDLRWQSYLLSIWAFGAACAINLDVKGLSLTSQAILGAIVVIALEFFCQFAIPRGWEPRFRLEEYARSGFAVLGALLLATLLYVEAPGSRLTVALGVEGVGLLVAGFAIRERIFRLIGIQIFFFCIAKLFLYDLRNLETPAKIVAFIVLGLLLIATSWAYTRFREQVRRIL